MLTQENRRAVSAGTIGRPLATKDEVENHNEVKRGLSEDAFKIQNWLNEKSVRNIQVSFIYIQRIYGNDS